MRRRKMGRQASRRDFTRNAVRKPRVNYRSSANPMRGGIRL